MAQIDWTRISWSVDEREEGRSTKGVAVRWIRNTAGGVGPGGGVRIWTRRIEADSVGCKCACCASQT